LIEEAGRWADRISLNVELPTAAGLAQLAPEKNMDRTRAAMTRIKDRITAAKAERQESRKAPTFAPAGQSTQMIVGATDAPDATILEQASSLYSEHKLRRVYYSAFSPIPDASSKLPTIAPPLVREHRLYQADWLLRFYGFKVHELTTTADPNLDLAIDPKLAWALRNRHIFPLDLNKAPRELLLRIPGVGTKSVDRILQVRRWHKIRLADLPRLHISMRKVLPFVVVADHNAAALTVDAGQLLEKFRPAESQMKLFPDSASTVTGPL
jgi:predicted DNA-binding helix-hairpin-helix protein